MCFIVTPTPCALLSPPPPPPLLHSITLVSAEAGPSHLYCVGVLVAVGVMRTAYEFSSLSVSCEQRRSSRRCLWHENSVGVLVAVCVM